LKHHKKVGKFAVDLVFIMNVEPRAEWNQVLIDTVNKEDWRQIGINPNP